MDVFPDFDGIGGIGDLRAVIGALLTFVLITAVLMLIVCAIVWALATANGHHAAASKARIPAPYSRGRNGLLGCGSCCAASIASVPSSLRLISSAVQAMCASSASAARNSLSASTLS